MGFPGVQDVTALCLEKRLTTVRKWSRKKAADSFPPGHLRRTVPAMCGADLTLNTSTLGMRYIVPFEATLLYERHYQFDSTGAFEAVFSLPHP